MFEVNNKDTRTMSMTSFWCLYCLLWIYFQPFSRVSIVNFEHEIASWKRLWNEAKRTDHRKSKNVDHSDLFIHSDFQQRFLFLITARSHGYSKLVTIAARSHGYSKLVTIAARSRGYSKLVTIRVTLKNDDSRNGTARLA